MSGGIAKNKIFLKKNQFFIFFNKKRKMKELIGETQEPKKAEKPQQRATYVSNLPKKEHQS